MDLPRDQEADALASLEERIQKAVEVVAALRMEKAALEERLAAAQAEREAAVEAAAQAQGQTGTLAREVESLRAERKQVRSRIEKLLGQMDLLSQT